MLRDAAVSWLSERVEVIEMPLPHDIVKLIPGSPPTLYVDSSCAPEEQLDGLLDVLRIVTLGEDSARVLQPMIPGQRGRPPTAVRHLRPVS